MQFKHVKSMHDVLRQVMTSHLTSISSVYKIYLYNINLGVNCTIIKVRQCNKDTFQVCRINAWRLMSSNDVTLYVKLVHAPSLELLILEHRSLCRFRGFRQGNHTHDTSISIYLAFVFQTILYADSKPSLPTFWSNKCWYKLGVYYYFYCIPQWTKPTLGYTFQHYNGCILNVSQQNPSITVIRVVFVNIVQKISRTSFQ